MQDSIEVYASHAFVTAFLHQLKSAANKVEVLTPCKPPSKPLMDVGLLYLWEKSPFPSRVNGHKKWVVGDSLGDQDTRIIKVPLLPLPISLAFCLVA